MRSVKLNWSSITTPRFLTVLEGVMVDKPSCIEKLWWSEGLAETRSSSVLARLSWRWWSFIQLEISDRLQYEQLPSDHLVGKRSRVECHQHSSDKKKHASEWPILVTTCRWRREVAQALSLEEPQKQEVVTKKPHPFKTYLRGKTQTTGARFLRCPSFWGWTEGSGG